MVATVQIIEKNGAGPTTTQKDGGTVRFKNADNATVDNNNPMIVPGAGSDFSFEKWLRFNITVAPSTELDNLKFYTDGSIGFGTGVTWWAKAVTAYATPTEPSASTGYTNAQSYTSGSSLSLGAGPFTGTGEKGDHLVTMLEVASTASQGALTGETGTFSYDEI